MVDFRASPTGLTLRSILTLCGQWLPWWRSPANLHGGFSGPCLTGAYLCQCQWEFQDPKLEVLYHIRPYFEGIFPYIALKNRHYIWQRYLQFRFLKWPMTMSANGVRICVCVWQIWLQRRLTWAAYPQRLCILHHLGFRRPRGNDLRSMLSALDITLVWSGCHQNYYSSKAKLLPL